MHSSKRSTRSVYIFFVLVCFMFFSCGGGGGSGSTADSGAGSGTSSPADNSGNNDSDNSPSDGTAPNDETAEVALGWDPSPSPDVVGYLLYYKAGECGGEYDGTGADQGDSPIDVGDVTEQTVTGLMENQTHCFAVSAYDAEGTESVYSDPIRFHTGGAAASLPVADAGPDQTAGEGEVVLLDAANSWNPDGRALTYLWEQTDGTAVSLEDADTDLARFETPDLGGGSEALTFQVTVADTGGNRSTDTVIVNVTGADSAPVADAGADQTVSGGETVALDARDSFDTGGGIDTYHWSQTAGEPVSLSDASDKQPTFTAPEVGEGSTALTFALTVTNSEGLQAADQCIVNVTSQNVPPEANAGSNQNVNSGDSVTLDGSASYDSDDGIASFRWIQVAGPPVALSDSSETMPSFIAPDTGADDEPLEFELIVTDGAGLKGSDRCTVSVLPN